eukprot:TRINITY_DN8508_c0_g2_i4.p1 TRINITY_DN8508_c0_g2~~TRINITY_DN8508_c0_g2_i4.p1  ORF type:complete len:167 (+),score=39.79 TRINITY_DN8508_c0_g2_i4:453-953(+)
MPKEHWRNLLAQYDHAYAKGIEMGRELSKSEMEEQINRTRQEMEGKLSVAEKAKREAEASAMPNYNVPLTQGERNQVLTAFQQREQEIQNDLEKRIRKDLETYELAVKEKEFACFDQYKAVEACKLNTSHPLKCRDAVNAFSRCALEAKKAAVRNKMTASSTQLQL